MGRRGLQKPRRAADPHHVKDDPEYGMNYIKRLIATGPASVVILDGDVYLAPACSIASISAAGSTVTVSTTSPHTFSVGAAAGHGSTGVETADYNGSVLRSQEASSTPRRSLSPPAPALLTPAALAAVLRGGTVAAGTAPPWKDNKPPFMIQRKPNYVQDAAPGGPSTTTISIPHLGRRVASHGRSPGRKKHPRRAGR